MAMSLCYNEERVGSTSRWACRTSVHCPALNSHAKRHGLLNTTPSPLLSLRGRSRPKGDYCPDIPLSFSQCIIPTKRCPLPFSRMRVLFILIVKQTPECTAGNISRRDPSSETVLCKRASNLAFSGLDQTGNRSHYAFQLVLVSARATKRSKRKRGCCQRLKGVDAVARRKTFNALLHPGSVRSGHVRLQS